MKQGLALAFLTCVATFAAVLLPAAASAAIPNTVLIEGALHATGGGAAADGDYALTFSLLTSGGNPVVWKEGPVTVAVKNAAFVHALGSVTPLDPALLAGADGLSLQVQVGSDPALPKQPLNSVLFALRAGLAENLACSGCVTAAQLSAKVIDDLVAAGRLSPVAKSGAFSDLSGGPDLSTYALTAKLAKVATSGTYADLLGMPDLTAYAKAASLAAVASSGNYTDLENLPVLAKVGAACGTGLVMQGIKADGSYSCVAGGLDPSNLPKDGLDEISNGLLFNQFNEVAASAKVPIALPDNNPVGISDAIDVPDFGTAQALTISAEIANSDTGNLKVNLVDPAGTKYVLWDKSAKGTLLKTTWPGPTKTVSGDLTTWVGKNPKGKWYLQVIDTAFLNNGLDGELKAWSVQVQVLASGKVGVGGALVLKNIAEPPYPCVASVIGSVYFDTKTDTIRYCSKAGWRSLADTCGNGIVETNEDCDDGNNTDGDGCSATCQTVCGDGKKVGKEECDDSNTNDGDGCNSTCIAEFGGQYKPGATCKDILAKLPTAKSGVYWIKPGPTAFAVYCNMTMDGGGWTALAYAPTYAIGNGFSLSADSGTPGNLSAGWAQMAAGKAVSAPWFSVFRAHYQYLEDQPSIPQTGKLFEVFVDYSSKQGDKSLPDLISAGIGADWAMGTSEGVTCSSNYSLFQQFWNTLASGASGGKGNHGYCGFYHPGLSSEGYCAQAYPVSQCNRGGYGKFTWAWYYVR
jgi:cysteine-rich repeat protein